MKTKQKVAILALAALVTGTSHAAITGKSSGFMDKRQLAAWRAEAASNVAVTKEDAPAFFTGRPYLASSGSYAFKYRSYDPGSSRWTSEDPSGFPDGANSSIYAPVPTAEIDWQGLVVVNFQVVTEIRAGSQAGVKSTHTVVVDTDARSIALDIYTTGVTNIPMVGTVGSRNDNFKGVLNSVDDCHINLTMNGSTASQAFPAAIDYSFNIYLSLIIGGNGAASLATNHDGYPSYEYYVNGGKYYDYVEKNLADLGGGLDITDLKNFDTGIENYLCE